jgi:Spy/CpxP family protein refolding chaperone
MIKPKTIIASLAVMVLLVGSSIASADGWGHRGCFGSEGYMGQRHGAWLAKLGTITKEQKAQFDKIHNEFLKKIEALRSQKAKETIELAELATKSPVDEKAIQKKKEEIWSLKDKMIGENRAFGTSVRKILTPEQREQLRTMFEYGPLAQIPDLTKAEKQKIDSLKIDFLKQKFALKAKKDQKKIELLELLSKSPQDENAIQKNKEEIWTLKDQLIKARRTFGTSVRAVLTPEQRDKLGVWGGEGHGKGMM